MNVPVRTPASIAERARRRALWGVEQELRALAHDASAIADKDDRESDAAIDAVANALEGVQKRIRTIRSKGLQP